jgi:primosomal protein N' (replication factor Y)
MVAPPGRVCRVQPDVPAVRRAFDYLVPDELARDVHVGTIVRVPLHGRRVRGWVLDADLAPDAIDAPRARLRPLRALVSAGPPGDVIDVCAWAAWRWAGPIAGFLRAATAPNVVAVDEHVEPTTAVYPTLLEPDHPWAGDALVLEPPVARLGSVRPLLAPEGSTLVLVPSASMASGLATMLRADGREVVVLSSDRSDADVTRAWSDARRGGCVVVGGRAAAWAPVPDLTTVIVVDEADEAYDAERAPTWSARDVVVERARRVGATVRMLTPAPSVEAFVRFGEPAGPASPRWPRIEVVDVRDQEPGQSLLTRELADGLHRTLARGEHALCVLNRTGRARLLACRSCQELARCERCGATVGERDENLVCRVCDTVRPRVCLHCHATRFRPVKPGVAGVRDDLAALLPRVRVESVEASSAGAPDAEVLIGTEAVLHRAMVGVGGLGHSAPNPVGSIGLVAYLELDQELLAPRLHAAEQALWLIVRGARHLTPRPSPDAGTLLLQTRLPDHEVVQAVVRGDPVAVARAETARRAELGFPPFGGLAALSGVAAAVGAACDALRASPAGVTVLGPVDDGKRALVRAPSWEALADALADPRVEAARTHGRLRVDVDPRRSA